MGPDGSFAYSQARLQARFGNRLRAGDWHRLQSMRNLASVLQAVRDSPFAAWTQGLGPSSPAHEIERRLRGGWTGAVDEVSNWQPVQWRPAMQWLRWLVYVPALPKRARGGRAPDWMRADPVIGPVVALELQARPGSLARTGMAPLAAGFSDRADVAGAWANTWRKLWPERARSTGTDWFIRELGAHYESLRALPASERSESLRAEFEGRLQRAFRRNPMSMTAGVAYLGLHALDAIRLRGVLVTQALREPGRVLS
jgi:hypothetical protein